MRPSPQIVPRHEPEIVQAIADRMHRGDTEKVPTTSLDSLTVQGILLSSRYGKAHEYETMAAMAAALPERVARGVHSIFCDSQACDAFTVAIPTWDVDLARRILDATEAVCMVKNGGHNGISIREGDRILGRTLGRSIHLAADWIEGIDEV